VCVAGVVKQMSLRIIIIIVLASSHEAMPLSNP